MSIKPLFIFFGTFFLFSQSLMGQEPHLRKPKTIEELMEKNRPNEYRSIKNHDYYLIVEKLGTMKRNKIFIGDWFGFKTYDDIEFRGNIAEISDSTFSLTYYDKTENRLQNRKFEFKDIRLLFKRDLKKGIEYRFSPFIFLPFVFDWIYFGREPWSNVSNLFYLAGIEGVRVLAINRKKLYNKKRLEHRWRIRPSRY